MPGSDHKLDGPWEFKNFPATGRWVWLRRFIGLSLDNTYKFSHVDWFSFSLKFSTGDRMDKLRNISSSSHLLTSTRVKDFRPRERNLQYVVIQFYIFYFFILMLIFLNFLSIWKYFVYCEKIKQYIKQSISKTITSSSVLRFTWHWSSVHLFRLHGFYILWENKVKHGPQAIEGYHYLLLSLFSLVRTTFTGLDSLGHLATGKRTISRHQFQKQCFLPCRQQCVVTEMLFKWVNWSA